MASSPYIHTLQAGPTACRQTDTGVTNVSDTYNPASFPHVGFILTQWPERTFKMEVGSCQSTLIMLRCLHFPQRRAQALALSLPFSPQPPQPWPFSSTPGLLLPQSRWLFLPEILLLLDSLTCPLYLLQVFASVLLPWGCYSI